MGLLLERVDGAYASLKDLRAYEDTLRRQPLSRRKRDTKVLR